MIIVDTDILIDAGRNVFEAIHCLDQIEQEFSIAVSSVTQMELIVGCRDKKELHSLEQFMKRFYVLRLDEQISDTALDLLKKYRLSHGL
ncbi:MAG: PIN domain-containing protein, partial [Deltaproteobacteria bacterium]|nr:PIN domain-containing protein [Deltaproteobacteria bacterium]